MFLREYNLKGKAKVVKDNFGFQLAVAEYGPGSIFGEMSFIEAEVTNTSVVAEDSCGVVIIGHALVQRCGIVPGDRVAIAMRNYPEWMLSFAAATTVGAIAVGICGAASAPAARLAGPPPARARREGRGRHQHVDGLHEIR